MRTKRVSRSVMLSIIETRKPLGLFYCVEDDKTYSGCDNIDSVKKRNLSML